MLLYGWKSLKISHHLAMLGVHWSSASADITYLICHVTLREYVIEWSNGASLLAIAIAHGLQPSQNFGNQQDFINGLILEQIHGHGSIMKLFLPCEASNKKSCFVPIQ